MFDTGFCLKKMLEINFCNNGVQVWDYLCVTSFQNQSEILDSACQNAYKEYTYNLCES